MKILGISAYYHDAAAALLIDGQVAAAAQEERFTRKKHDSSFPHHAIASCLAATGTRPSEIDFRIWAERVDPATPWLSPSRSEEQDQ